MSSKHEPISYLSDPALTKENLTEFFKSASALWAVHPWTMLDDAELVRVEAPAIGIHDGCVKIADTDYDEPGVWLYASEADYVRMETSTPDAPQSYRALHLSFVALDAVPEVARGEASAHGWPLRSGDACPGLQCIVDDLPAPVTAADFKLAVALSRALATFVELHPRAFERYGAEKLRQSFDYEDLTLTLSVPHSVAGDDHTPHAPRAPTLTADNPYGLPLDAGKLSALEQKLGR